MKMLTVSPAYTALLSRFPPRVIRSDEQNESFVAALYELEQRQAQWTVEEFELADLLTLLIEDYEDKSYTLPRSSLVAVLEFLLEQHSLNKNGLDDVFESPEDRERVWSGQRELDTAEIRALSSRFQVSPDIFF